MHHSSHTTQPLSVIRPAFAPFLLTLLLTLATFPATAGVTVERSSARLSEYWQASGPIAGEPSLLVEGVEGEGANVVTRENEPEDGLWFVPRYRVNKTAVGDTTLWAVRNEEAFSNVSLGVEYFTTTAGLVTTQNINLVPDQVATRNVRDVPAITADPDGFARGFIRFTANNDVSVDYLQVDTAENFAQGSVAFNLGDFCQSWMLRFASFAPGEGSVASFLVNGPRGNGTGAPPTLAGEVYDEAGNFLNSFTVKSDEWAFDVEILDLVGTNDAFGSIELIMDSTLTPLGGVAQVAHSAEGRFSVGLPGICKDNV